MHHRIRHLTRCIAIAALAACADGSRPTVPSAWSIVAQRELFDVDAITFTTIDVPGSAGTFAMDINSNDDVVGRFMTAGQTHGFLRSAAGEFTTIDYPGASFTVAAGVNSEGDVVGTYALPSAPTERHGFLLRGAEFTTIDPDGSKFTNALGINARGDVVGRYCTSLPCGRPGSGKYHGFLWRDGEITSFDVPDSHETNAWKINADGDIIGGFRYADGINRLFILRGGEFTTFDLPGALPVAQDDGGFNARGDIVGVYCATSPCDFAGPVNHGFVLSQGELATIDFPGSTATVVLGVNARGSLAGAYVDASGRNHGFLVTKGSRP